MALIVTPGTLAKRAEFYYQLSAMIRAGLTLIKALETVERKPPGPGYRRQIRQLLDHLNAGNSFTHSLNLLGTWLPAFDQALLEAGERSGRIDECFKMLSEYYEASAKRVRGVIGRLLYPIGLMHFALMIFPLGMLTRMITEGEVNEFLIQKLITFLPAYLILFALIFIIQSNRFDLWRSILEKIFALVPYLGSARKALALNRLSSSLESLINAGVTIIDAWELSAAASGSPTIQREVSKWRPQIETDGITPGELAVHSRVFPEMFSSLYHTGEISGQIDESLLRLREYYQEESNRKLDMFTKVLTTMIVMGVMITVAYFIISFYVGFYEDISEQIDAM